MLAILAAGCGGGGGGESTPAQVTAAATDGIGDVVARTGPILTVRVGEMVTLDGTRSFTSSTAPLSFSWSLSAKPDASDAELQNPTGTNPGFVADAWGAYVAQLVVSAEGVSSQRAIQIVVATIAPEQDVFHEGLSSNCVNCHNDDFSTIPAKPPAHLASSNLCATCHIPTSLGFPAIHFVDHREVIGNCSQCHNGVVAIGKSEFHSPTDAECDDCHDTTQFLTLEPDGSFDHSSISRSCTGCHNGQVAMGKTPTPPHPDTSSECGACHTTESFLGAYPDHTGPEVTNNRCDSCHGITATGQPGGHPGTFVDCVACHSIATFSLGGVFNHRIDPTVQPCESCHNDTNSINAPGKSSAVPVHLATVEDCGACHNTTSFADAVVDHTAIVDDCASCHGVTASGKSVNHMPTIEDCSVCHTPGTFATGTYDHFNVVNNCESCHDNVITIGKLINHLPTSEDCSVCHDTTDFAGVTFNHVGIDINNCATCHDGEISLGKSANHLPTALDCSSCHVINDYTSFAGITFNHLGIDPNDCATCHDAGIATPKKVNHIPAQDDCSVCHDSTSSFTSTTFLITLHLDISRGCEGCHVSQFFPVNPDVVKAAGHLPTGQDCSLCHTTTAFVPSNFDHTGIADNCESCHDGSAGFAGLGARGKTNTPVHQNTSGDCALCHNTTSFADAFVDHTSPEVLGSRCDSCHNGMDATGMDAKPDHVVTTEDCAVCHVPSGSFVPAVFSHIGITDNCESCHNGVDATGKDAKIDPPHIPTTDDCSVCHTPTSFAAANFDHQGIVDNCASCHNGNTATGKAGNHVPTNGDCVDCHQTTGFLPASFDHVGIVDNCASCHDAGFATPKSNDHLQTSQDCGVCHNTRYFVPASFEHTGIVDNCESCHDGRTAIGKDAAVNPPHMATALDCHFCHTTATFVGGTWVHDNSTIGRCDDCHSPGGGATFKPNDHLATTVQCDACHVTMGWAPTSFSHDPQGDYPGDHRIDPGCSGCHGGSVNSTFVYPSPQYAPFCAGCHERDFDRKGNHIGGENGTVEQNKDCSGGGRGCHRITDSKFD